jgi:hypothetical protein
MCIKGAGIEFEPSWKDAFALFALTARWRKEKKTIKRVSFLASAMPNTNEVDSPNLQRIARNKSPFASLKRNNKNLSYKGEGVTRAPLPARLHYRGVMMNWIWKVDGQSAGGEFRLDLVRGCFCMWGLLPIEWVARTGCV